MRNKKPAVNHNLEDKSGHGFLIFLGLEILKLGNHNKNKIAFLNFRAFITDPNVFIANCQTLA